MATNIGTGPQDIPLNQFLGEMAFMDNIFEDGGTYKTWISDGINTHYSNVFGQYGKIGNWVIANITIRNPGSNSINTGGGVGLPWRFGLPYRIEDNGGEYYTGVIGYKRFVPNITNGDWLNFFINANAAYDYCNIVWSGNSLTETTTFGGALSGSTLLGGQLIYRTNGIRTSGNGPGSTS
jgi:hypothetical protein